MPQPADISDPLRNTLCRGGVRSHGLKDADDVVELFLAEHSLRPLQIQVGVRGLVEPAWFDDAVGRQLIHD